MAVRLDGNEPLTPGLMSLTSTVPAAVPSLFHSSAPAVPSVALKKTAPPTPTKLAGDEELFASEIGLTPGKMSLTSAVPAAVPAQRRQARG